MDRVKRFDDKLREIKKPELEQLDSLFIEKKDALILCAGFEDRALSTLKQQIMSGNSGFAVFAFRYLPYVKENKFEEIKELCEKNAINMVELIYDRQNPAGSCDKIISLLNGVDGRIYIDISAMSRLLIVQIIVSLFRSSHGFENVVILYTEASEYPPEEEEVRSAIAKIGSDSVYRTMFISSGVLEVTVVPELSSVSLLGQPIRLVTFPSFNTDQLATLRGELQPSSFSFIHGIPHLPENAWRLNAIKKLNHIEEILQREDMNASTLDYRETLDRLLEIYSKHGVMERIILSPIGSKMQSVAVGLFKAFIDEIQIVYPTPRSFVSPSEYTKGVFATYSLCLQSFCF
jgi:hypothetical protein